MRPADGVVDDAVTNRRNHWRGALIGVGVAVAAGLLTLFAPSSAQADDATDSGLLHGVVGELTQVVDEVVSPVVEPLPALREVPVVGGLVGEIVDSKPVITVTQPVANVVDGLLGDTVASLPVVGEILGDRPVGTITDPVAGTVDDALGGLADGGAAPVPPTVVTPAPELFPAFVGTDAATHIVADGIAALLLPALASVDVVGVVVAGAENSPVGGFASLPGDSMPTSAVTAGGPPGGLAVAVLGAGLLLLLFAGRLRLEPFRAPPSPTYDTDSSPD